ncbi:hypothetical protein V1279_004836 [Bradyrhizobium sp. AZCC 1610]
MGSLNMVFGIHRDVIAEKPGLVRVMLGIHQTATDFASKDAMVAMASNKLGRKKEAIEASVPQCRTDMAARSKADRAVENLCRPHAGAEADQAAAGFLSVHRHQLRRCGEANLSVTTLASDSDNSAVAEHKASWMATWWPRLRQVPSSTSGDAFCPRNCIVITAARRADMPRRPFRGTRQ